MIVEYYTHNLKLDTNKEVAFILTDRFEEHGMFMAGTLQTLGNIQNDVIKELMEKLNELSSKSQTSLSFITKQFALPIKLQEASEDHILALKNLSGEENINDFQDKLAIKFSYTDPEYGQGNSIIYDYKSIEEELCKKLLLGRRTLDTSLKFIQYQLELYLGDNSDILTQLEKKDTPSSINIQNRRKSSVYTFENESRKFT